jgi:hypothetical protein
VGGAHVAQLRRGEPVQALEGLRELRRLAIADSRRYLRHRHRRLDQQLRRALHAHGVERGLEARAGLGEGALELTLRRKDGPGKLSYRQCIVVVALLDRRDGLLEDRPSALHAAAGGREVDRGLQCELGHDRENSTTVRATTTK